MGKEHRNGNQKRKMDTKKDDEVEKRDNNSNSSAHEQGIKS